MEDSSIWNRNLNYTKGWEVKINLFKYGVGEDR